MEGEKPQGEGEDFVSVGGDDSGEESEGAVERRRVQRFSTRRTTGGNMREIHRLITEMGPDVCLNDTEGLAEEIWEEAQTLSPGDAEGFFNTVPSAGLVGPSGLAFMIRSIPKKEYNRDTLVYVMREFLRLRILDYEIAWGFDHSLPFYYRDGTRITEKTFGGADTTPITYFLRQQWHLNDNAYNRLLEEVTLGDDFSAQAFRGAYENFPIKNLTDEPYMFPWSDRGLDDLVTQLAQEVGPVDMTLVPFGKGASTKMGAKYPEWYMDGFGIDFRKLSKPKAEPKKAEPKTESTPKKGATVGTLGKGRTGGSGRPDVQVEKPTREAKPKEMAVRGSGRDPSPPGGSSSDESDLSPEGHRKKQYSKGGDFSKFGEVSFRDDEAPLYSYKKEDRGGVDKFVEKFKAKSEASGLSTEKAALASIYLGGVKEIVDGGLGSRGRSVKVVKEPKREASSTRLKDFDINLNGTNLDEILGSVFKEVVFRSDVERQSVAKDLLQIVLFSDGASRTAKAVALEEYSKLNTGALLQQTMDMATGASKMGMTSVLLDTNPGKLKEIDPPVFGKENSVHGNIIKNLLSSVGGKRLSIPPKDGSKPIIHALSTIAGAITVNGLSANAAFVLMLNVSAGTLYDYVYAEQTSSNESGNPASGFRELWKYMQQIGHTEVNASSYEDSIQRLVLAKPKNLNETLFKLETFIKKMFEDHPNPADRKTLIREKSLSYLRYWVNVHYPEYFTVIDSVYEDAFKCNETAKRNAAIQGVEHVSDFQPVRYMIQIILNQIHRRNGMFNGLPMALKTKVASAAITEVSEDEVVESAAADIKQVSKPAQKKQGGNYNGKVMSSQVRQIQVPAGAHAAPVGAAADPRGYNNNLKGEQQDKVPHCRLCNKKNHATNQCFTYNEKPGGKVCDRCGGRHTSECRMKVFNNNPRGEGYRGYQNQGYQNRGNGGYQGNLNQGSQSRGNGGGYRGGYSQGRSQGQRSNNQQYQKPNNSGNGNQMQMGQGIGSTGRQAVPAGSQ